MKTGDTGGVSLRWIFLPKSPLGGGQRGRCLSQERHPDTVTAGRTPPAGWGRRSRSSSNNIFCVAGCDSDNGRNLIAATALGLVVSFVGSVVVLAEHVVGFLLGILLFLQDSLGVLSLGLRVSLLGIFLLKPSTTRRPVQSHCT